MDEVLKIVIACALTAIVVAFVAWKLAIAYRLKVVEAKTCTAEEKAREIMDQLMPDFMCQYEEKDSIGKRYRRQDAIGTPLCVTIDNQTLEDNTVTVRDRDTMEQIRVKADELYNIIRNKIAPKKI